MSTTSAARDGLIEKSVRVEESNPGVNAVTALIGASELSMLKLYWLSGMVKPSAKVIVPCWWSKLVRTTGFHSEPTITV